MLDRLPVWARDLLVALAAALVGWAGADLVPLLQGSGRPWAALLAPLAVLFVNAVTPYLTQQYGAAHRPAATEPQAAPGAPD